MTPAEAHPHSPTPAGLEPGAGVPKLLAWLLPFDRFVRSRPVLMGVVAVVLAVSISLAKVRDGDATSLALTFDIPVALCAYSIGLVAGLGMATVGAGLWLMDAVSSGLSEGAVAYIFTVRLLSNFGIAGLAAVARIGVRAREQHIADQAELMRLRSEFVAAFTHDLRTPLGSIVGYADLLRESLTAEVSADLVHGLERIQVNARQLNTLISDMILAEQSPGGVRLTVTAFEIADVVRDLRNEFDQVGYQQSPTLVWHVETGIPPVHSDRSKLTSVIRNLVANALKFTTQGSVQVRIAHNPTTDTHSIDVDDTGPGIAPEEVPHVFDRFYRGKDPSAGGFGLGLYIVKRFTEMLGGTVSVRSERGRGTRFSVAVPPLPLSDSKTC